MGGSPLPAPARLQARTAAAQAALRSLRRRPSSQQVQNRAGPPIRAQALRVAEGDRTCRQGIRAGIAASGVNRTFAMFRARVGGADLASCAESLFDSRTVMAHSRRVNSEGVVFDGLPWGLASRRLDSRSPAVHRRSRDGWADRPLCHDSRGNASAAYVGGVSPCGRGPSTAIGSSRNHRLAQVHPCRLVPKAQPHDTRLARLRPYSWSRHGDRNLARALHVGTGCREPSLSAARTRSCPARCRERADQDCGPTVRPGLPLVGQCCPDLRPCPVLRAAGRCLRTPSAPATGYGNRPVRTCRSASAYQEVESGVAISHRIVLVRA